MKRIAVIEDGELAGNMSYSVERQRDGGFPAGHEWSDGTGRRYLYGYTGRNAISSGGALPIYRLIRTL